MEMEWPGHELDNQTLPISDLEFELKIRKNLLNLEV